MLALIGPVVSVVAIVAILRQLDPARLVGELKGLELLWIAIIVPVYVSAHLARGVRWQLMISPIKPVAWRISTSLVFVGLMANYLLPARLGELVRALALRRSEQLPAAFALASIGAERLFDALALLVVFVVVALVTPFPPQHATTIATLGGLAAAALLLALALVLLARLIPRRIENAARSAGAWLPAWARTFAAHAWISVLDAIAFLKLDRTLLFLVVLTLGIWLIEGAVLWLATLVFGLDPDPRLAYFTLVMLGLGVAVPSAPGYFGVFEACIVLAFAAFGLAREVALSYALVVHALHLTVVTIGGVVSLHVLGMSFGALRELGRKASTQGLVDGA